MAIDMGYGWIPIDAEGYHLEWSRSRGSYPRNLMGRCHLALDMTCLVLSRAVLCLFLLANCKKILPTTYTIAILFVYTYTYITIYIYIHIILFVYNCTYYGWLALPISLCYHCMVQFYHPGCWPWPCLGILVWCMALSALSTGQWLPNPDRLIIYYKGLYYYKGDVNSHWPTGTIQ